LPYVDVGKTRIGQDMEMNLQYRSHEFYFFHLPDVHVGNDKEWTGYGDEFTIQIT